MMSSTMNNTMDERDLFQTNKQISPNIEKTPLMLAAMENDLTRVKYLLDRGVDVNVVDKDGLSALHHIRLFHGHHWLTCFQLITTSNGVYCLDRPGANGQTFLQIALKNWDKQQCDDFFRFLMSENCRLSGLEIRCPVERYSDLDEFDSDKRQRMRKILYESGAGITDILIILNFEREHLYEDTKEYENEFLKYCYGVSLRSKCRRIIRQSLGLGIKQKVLKLGLPLVLQHYILLNVTGTSH
ncbi:hypothetical protein SNE40_001680 [Patella caerulea]|uniref:Uncharacterized protein n=1 Tax=Patella caerulea TaxID=87958 RepID=A0AAN8Q6K8_PATCE